MSRPERPYQRLLLRNTAVTGITGIWAVALAAAIVPVLLSRLGTEEFGLWALLWSFSAVNGWLSLATVGLATASTRRTAAAAVAGEPAAAAGTVTLFGGVGIILGLVVLGAGPAALGAMVATDASLTTPFEQAIRWSALWIGGEATFVGCAAVLEGRQRVDQARALDATRRTVVSGAAVAAALSGASIAGVMAASGVAAIGAAAAAVGVLCVGSREFRPLGRPRELGVLAADTRRLMTLNASGVLHRSMDRMLVATMIGPAAVAAVEVASRLRDIAQLVLSTSSHTTISAASWLDAQAEEAKLQRLVAVGTRLSLLATWGTVAVLAVYASPLIELWLGDRTPEDVVPLALLGLAYTAAVAPLQVGVNALTGTGRVARVTVAAWTGVLVNLVASVILIEQWGVVGAFVGTLFGTVVVIPLLAPAVLDLFGPHRLRALGREVVRVLPPPVLVALGGVVVAAAGWSPVPTLVVGAAITIAVGVPAALRWSVGRDDLLPERSPQPVSA